MSKRIRGHEWFEIRDKVLKRDDFTCVNCGSGSNLIVHHIVPISEQGTNRLSNLVSLCRECHRLAHNHRWGVNSSSGSRLVTRDIFTVDEVSKVLMSTMHPLYTALLMTIAKTGIGVGELCNLNIQDVDIDNFEKYSGSITEFSGSGLRIRYGGEIPYSNRRERYQDTIVPIDDQLELELKRWIAIRPAHPHNRALFRKTTSNWGRRMDPSTVHSIFQRISQPHGLYVENNQMGNFTPLSLRYFFEEQFRGKPKYREYILGRNSPDNVDYKSLEENYRHSIFKL